MAECVLAILYVDKWENIGSTFYVNAPTKGILKMMHTCKFLDANQGQILNRQ